MSPLADFTDPLLNSIEMYPTDDEIDRILDEIAEVDWTDFLNDCSDLNSLLETQPPSPAPFSLQVQPDAIRDDLKRVFKQVQEHNFASMVHLDTKYFGDRNMCVVLDKRVSDSGHKNGVYNRPWFFMQFTDELCKSWVPIGLFRIFEEGKQEVPGIKDVVIHAVAPVIKIEDADFTVSKWSNLPVMYISSTTFGVKEN